MALEGQVDSEPGPGMFPTQFMREHGGQISMGTRQNGSGPFMKQSYSDLEDDDAALMRIALEKLSNKERLRTALLPSKEAGEGGTAEKYRMVDVKRLTKEERKALVEGVLTADANNELLLRRWRERVDKCDVKIPTVEVRYENLSIEADVYVGSRALPTLVNWYRNALESFLIALRLTKSGRRSFPILRDVSGVLKPGRMTLLLGPPSSGKSTLLLALAGKLQSGLRSSGKITYNGKTLDQFEPRSTSAYIPQYDEHLAELTVRETLDFAARVQGVGKREEMLEELDRKQKELKLPYDAELDALMKARNVSGKKHNVVTDIYLKLLGLDICSETIVGNAMLRGISGGQKKRVTTGEMVVGPKKVLFMDEISTGLDSSTTFQIIKALRNTTHILEYSTLIALLQPAPETFDLFDDIILLSEGRLVYQGPRERILEFFEAQGFKCPPRTGIADFLQEVTSRKDQSQYWAGRGPHRYVPVSAFAEAFKSFDVGAAIAKELSQPFDEASRGHPAALVTRKLGLPRWQIFKACFEREVTLMSRNRFIYAFKTFQVFYLSFITATLFLRTTLSPTSLTDGNIYLGAIFFCLLIMMFNGLTEMSLTVARLPMFFKQRDNLFFPGWAEALVVLATRIPFSLTEAVVMSSIVYYSVGLAPEAGRFFTFFLALFLVHQMGIALFRTMAVLGRTYTNSNTYGMLTLIIILTLGGFVLSKNDIPPWWIWGYWISPLTYPQILLAVNEFSAPRWRYPDPANPGRTLGESVLSQRGIPTEEWWIWLSVGVICAFIVLFNFTYMLALTFEPPISKSGAAMSEEALKEKDKTRDGVGLTPYRTPARSSLSMQKSLALQASIPMAKVSGVMPVANGDAVPTNGIGGLEDVDLEGGEEHSTGGMSLPFQPLHMTFADVNYYVALPKGMAATDEPQGRLQLLRGVSGAFRPGVLTALMGASGAGKTTLLDVLAGRKTGGWIEGDIRISGHPKVQSSFARIAGYVEQTDIHSPHTTVHEALIFSASLRLPKEVPTETRMAFVAEVMDLVELTSLRDALVGLPGESGLSVEQRKRLTIAVELVANPSIIFMDEPTSGLDARAAAIVMRAVRNTVNTGRTVVCTIHQPSIQVFESFDDLLLLKGGGRTIYAGSLGVHSCELIKYFEAFPEVPRITDGYNPATWMLEITNPGAEARTGRDFADEFGKSENVKRLNGEIKALSVPKPQVEALSFDTEYSRNFGDQFKTILWKFNHTYWRNPQYNGIRFLFTLAVGLLFGTIFWNLGTKRSTQQDVFNVMGALYVSVIFLGFTNAGSVQPIVAVERFVSYRERAAGMYGPLPWALAQSLVEIPYIVGQTLIYSLVVYSMIHFEWTAAKFFWFLCFMFLTLTIFTFYGIMAIALLPNQQTAAICSSAFYAIWNVFAGFLIAEPQLPGWWVWFYYLNPVAYTLYGLIGSQLADVTEPFEIAGGGTETVQSFVESYFNFHYDFVWVCAIILLGFLVLFWAILGFGFKYINWQRR